MFRVISGTFFDADITGWSGDGLEGGGQLGALVARVAESPGGCVAEDQFCELLFVGCLAQAGEERARSSFFHLDRERVDVKGACV